MNWVLLLNFKKHHSIQVVYLRWRLFPAVASSNNNNNGQQKIKTANFLECVFICCCFFCFFSSSGWKTLICIMMIQLCLCESFRHSRKSNQWMGYSCEKKVTSLEHSNSIEISTETNTLTWQKCFFGLGWDEASCAINWTWNIEIEQNSPRTSKHSERKKLPVICI